MNTEPTKQYLFRRELGRGLHLSVVLVIGVFKATCEGSVLLHHENILSGGGSRLRDMHLWHSKRTKHLASAGTHRAGRLSLPRGSSEPAAAPAPSSASAVRRVLWAEAGSSAWHAEERSSAGACVSVPCALCAHRQATWRKNQSTRALCQSLSEMLGKSCNVHLSRQWPMHGSRDASQDILDRHG